jgi:hypothetical protein
MASSSVVSLLLPPPFEDPGLEDDVSSFAVSKSSTVPATAAADVSIIATPPPLPASPPAPARLIDVEDRFMLQSALLAAAAWMLCSRSFSLLRFLRAIAFSSAALCCAFL